MHSEHNVIEAHHVSTRVKLYGLLRDGGIDLDRIDLNEQQGSIFVKPVNIQPTPADLPLPQVLACVFEIHRMLHSRVSYC